MKKRDIAKLTGLPPKRLRKMKNATGPDKVAKRKDRAVKSDFDRVTEWLEQTCRVSADAGNMASSKNREH